MNRLVAIAAIVLFHFQKGVDAELQKLLVLAIIGGITISTLVSLYVVPLLFYVLKRRMSLQ